ncbi:hypothetical protein B7Z00_00350 [Candidatus Saccharibacteria bacterium 32-50-10]|nr:MAG: hypothetical protein B7Z00_00350 [Candidatus Saccharibacteria bacterium 32-50-10]
MHSVPNPERHGNEELNSGSISYADGVAKYLADASDEAILRPHQLDVFEDLEKFFEAGETRGYINLPTGTGKTVLFVELAKALREAGTPEQRPSILVVAPTKDLVHQTLGRTGEKGFGRFAPELNIGSYFSDSSDEEKKAMRDFDVVVTTYQSFNRLSQQFVYRPVEDFERDVAQSGLFKQLANTMGAEKARESQIKAVPTSTRLVDTFDVIILDEAHHALGENASHIVNSLAPDKVVIGFTATPDADDNRRLTSTLPSMIHELGLNEAIYMGLLAPVVPVGIKSGVQVRGSDIYDENGEFIDSRISYLAEDPKRNQLVVDTAKVLAEQGIGTIVSCIAGGQAWHARHLAEQLRSQGVRAAAVHASVPAETRQKVYEQFNKGELDVLTFVGVLGEGWDSPRAKGLVNARPTRSAIFSKQRLGRITRPGATAFAFDIYDDFEDENLPITVADVLNEGAIPLGQVVGTPDNAAQVEAVVRSVQNIAPTVMDSLQSTYREQTQLIAGLDKLYKGKLYGATGKIEFATATALRKNYHGLTDEIITRYEELNGVIIPKKLAAQGRVARTVYAEKEASEMLHTLPMAEPNKYYIDANQDKWIAPQGLVQLFSKRYPGVSTDVISDVLEMVGQSLEWIPTKHLTTAKDADFRHYAIIKMYNTGKTTIDTINAALAGHFAEA